MMESVVYLLDIAYFVYISKNWVYLQIPNIILSFCGVLWVMIQPETPRWLLAKKRYNDARAVFAMMARWNGKSEEAQVSEWVFEQEAEDANKPIGVEEDLETKKNEPQISWRDIWKIPVLRTNLWAAAILYTEATFNFYLLSFYMKYFPGNLFVNSVYFACSDLTAFIMAGLFLNFVGMKVTIRVAACLALTGGFMYLFLYSKTDLIPFMICLSRVGQSMIFNTTLICVNRLFPTLFIANAYGIVNFCAHMSACLSPFVAEIHDPIPFIFFVTFVSFAVFSSFFLT